MPPQQHPRLLVRLLLMREVNMLRLFLQRQRLHLRLVRLVQQIASGCELWQCVHSDTATAQPCLGRSHGRERTRGSSGV